MNRAGASRAIWLAAFLALIASRPAAADPIEDFYRGRQVALIVSTGTGGGYNEYAQAFAQFYGTHLPGRPSVVPQFMPGAGGIRATNFLYAVAPKDGGTLGFVYSNMTTADIFYPQESRFDATRFNWIGNMDGEPGMCAFWASSPAKSVEDLKAREYIVGSAGVGGAFDQHPRILNKSVGTKLKIVTGYTNGNEINLAMERGEVDGRCGWSPDSIESTRPSWLAEHKINLLVQFGLTKHRRYPQVPLILDLVADPDTREAVALTMAERDLLRPVLAPPEVPPDRVAALRRAFMDTMRDAAFVAELDRRKLIVTPMDGATMQGVIAQLHHASPAVMQRAIELGGSGSLPN